MAYMVTGNSTVRSTALYTSTKDNIKKLSVTGLFSGEAKSDQWFPAQSVKMRTEFPCHDVIMNWWETLWNRSVYYSGKHYGDVVIGTVASQITSLTIVYSTVYSGADQRKHQSSASLAFVRGIHRGPVNSAYKWPVTRKMFPFDDVIMG